MIMILTMKMQEAKLLQLEIPKLELNLILKMI